MANGFIANPQNLQDWFERAKGAKWNLYHGFQRGNLGTGNLIYRQSEELPEEDSFSLLLEMITMNSGQGADFTVFVPSNERGNQGLRVFYRAGANGAAASLSGTPGAATGYGANVGFVPADKVKDAVEIAMLRRDVEDLKSMGEPTGFGAIVMQNFANNPALLEGLAGAAIGLLNIAAAKMAGLPVQMQGGPQPASVSGPPNTTATTEIEIDEERVSAALGRIAAHFPDLAGALEALAGMIEANPTFAKSLLHQHLQQ